MANPPVEAGAPAVLGDLALALGLDYKLPEEDIQEDERLCRLTWD